MLPLGGRILKIIFIFLCTIFCFPKFLQESCNSFKIIKNKHCKEKKLKDYVNIKVGGKGKKNHLFLNIQSRGLERLSQLQYTPVPCGY